MPWGEALTLRVIPSLPILFSGAGEFQFVPPLPLPSPLLPSIGGQSKTPEVNVLLTSKKRDGYRSKWESMKRASPYKR